MNPLDGEWEIACTARQFEELRGDREFRFLVTIGRMLNALKFGVDTVSQPLSYSPRTARQAMSAFLYLAAVLHEFFEFLDLAEKHGYGGATAYLELKKVLDGAGLSDREKKLLRLVRNRAAFHFDDALAAEALVRMPLEKMVVAKGSGGSTANSYFELSDWVVIEAIFGDAKGLDATFAKVLDLHDTMAKLVKTIIQVAENVVWSRLAARGVRVAERSSDATS